MKQGSILKLLKNNEENEVASIDNVCGRFIKGVSDIFAILITQIWNLSIKLYIIY